MIEHRRAQQLEAGVRQLHLRLHSTRPDHAHSRGGRHAGRVIEQRRLPDARVASYHEHAALPVAGVGQQPLDQPALRGAPDQAGRRSPGTRGDVIAGRLDAADATSGPSLPGFPGVTGWVNSEPLAPADLENKVVLVGFWTYTCINWLRTLPYLRGGPRRTPTTGSSSWACTRPSSVSNTTSATCAGPSGTWVSSTRSRSTTRLYQLVRQPGPITEREFEIEFLGPGVEALCFTFG